MQSPSFSQDAPSSDSGEAQWTAALRAGVRVRWRGVTRLLLAIVGGVAAMAGGFSLTHSDLLPYAGHLAVTVALFGVVLFGRTNLVANAQGVGFVLGPRRPWRALTGTHHARVREVVRRGSRGELVEVFQLNFAGFGPLRFSSRWMIADDGFALLRYTPLAAAAAQTSGTAGPSAEATSALQAALAPHGSPAGVWGSPAGLVVLAAPLLLSWALMQVIEKQAGARRLENDLRRADEVAALQRTTPRLLGEPRAASTVAATPVAEPMRTARAVDPPRFSTATLVELQAWLAAQGHQVRPHPAGEGDLSLGTVNFVDARGEYGSLEVLDTARGVGAVRRGRDALVTVDGDGPLPGRVLRLVSPPPSDRAGLERALARAGAPITAPANDALAEAPVAQWSVELRQGSAWAAVTLLSWARSTGRSGRCAARSSGTRVMVACAHGRLTSAALLARLRP